MSFENIRGGLAGRILRVDLTNKIVSAESTRAYSRKWLSGRALSSWLMLDETPAATRWADPENPLIVGVGCLVGTSAPGASRVSIDSMSTFSSGKGSANFGGHFGAELKFAGIDHIVITGRSGKPVYLWIHDGEVELRDAEFLWGLPTNRTEERLQAELGDPRVRVVSIGPAGENLVRGSGIFGDCGQAAGGSGVGCVMGSKKLKAIAVRGTGGISVAEPERFLQAVDAALEKIEESPFIKGDQRFESFRHGLVISYKTGERPLSMPVRNAQDEFFPAERTARLLGKDQGVPRFHKKMWSCFACPLGCQPFLEIKDGAHEGTRGFAYWGNSMMYSIRVDSDDPASSVRFHMRSNELGLDADTASVTAAWAFECYEKGLLSKSETDGLELTWGNTEAWLALLEKMAYRQGIGDLLANGVVEASHELGRGSEKLIAHCKGQDTVEGFRGGLAWALGVATSPVGGHHLRGAVHSGVSGPKNLPLAEDKVENHAEAVFWQLRMKEIEDAAGVCVFMGSFSGAYALEPSDYAALINSALGLELSEDDLLTFGRRAYNLEKAFNTIHAGFERADDYPPERFFLETVKTGPRAGSKLDRAVYDQVLDRFYELNGWEPARGWQTREGLAGIDLDEVARLLSNAGKLVD